MKSRRADRLLVEDIRDAIDRISGYIAGMEKEAFLSDRRTIDAVARNLEVAGEVANRISEAARKRRSDIEWTQIIGLRNRIVHEYFGVDAEIVWEIITPNLPGLRSTLQSFLAQLPLE